MRGLEKWSCIDDRTYDGAPDALNLIGWGQSPLEAQADLERLFEERADFLEAYNQINGSRT